MEGVATEPTLEELEKELEEYANRIPDKVPDVVVASVEPESVAIVACPGVKTGTALRFNTTGSVWLVHPQSIDEFRVRMVELKKTERQMSRQEKRWVERKMDAYIDEVKRSQAKVVEREESMALVAHQQMEKAVLANKKSTLTLGAMSQP